MNCFCDRRQLMFLQTLYGMLKATWPQSTLFLFFLPSRSSFQARVTTRGSASTGSFRSMPLMGQSSSRLLGLSGSCLVLIHLIPGFRWDVIESMLEDQMKHRWWFLMHVRVFASFRQWEPILCCYYFSEHECHFCESKMGCSRVSAFEKANWVCCDKWSNDFKFSWVSILISNLHVLGRKFSKPCPMGVLFGKIQSELSLIKVLLFFFSGVSSSALRFIKRIKYLSKLPFIWYLPSFC